MNPFFCRAFQCCFAVGARFLPWRTPEVFSGSGSLLRVADILKKEASSLAPAWPWRNATA